MNPYEDIVEVRNVGRRRCNIYLANGWRLFGWTTEDFLEHRESSHAGYYKLQRVVYLVGRTEDVEFEGDDIFAYELEQEQIEKPAPDGTGASVP